MKVATNLSRCGKRGRTKYEAFARALIVIGLAATSCTGSSGSRSFGSLTPCDDPAPLSAVQSNPNLGYIVELREGVDASGEAERLAGTCGFEVGKVSPTGTHFVAPLDKTALGCVRCDAVVVQVVPDAILSPDTTGPGAP